ncbi:hypothetical protein QJS04_geneDACA021925 [Acorus gramineus]|uniref:Uncharacterized protein n=1 Tax=Acorus gramineus TaxID=55184 RepID=A0AAV9A560_ACOGR|nr:hypothetical protein QJS04_geneDACA021925 [Acorus gramineus]
MLTFTFVVAAYKAKGDPWALSFVVSIYAMLVLLFWCLNASDRVPHDSKAKKMYHVAVWSLGVVLNIRFSYEVSNVFPFAMVLIIWAMASFATVTTFYAFFVGRDGNREDKEH